MNRSNNKQTKAVNNQAYGQTNNFNKSENGKNKSYNFNKSYKLKSQIAQKDDPIRLAQLALFLNYKPFNLFDWQEAYVTYACKEFGDAGHALKNRQYPDWIDEDYNPIDDDLEVPNQENIVQYTIFKTRLESRIKKLEKDKDNFTKDSVKLCSDLVMHMCEESRRIVQQFCENYEDIISRNDFIALYDAIEESHLTGGGQTNVLVKKTAKDRLESLGQYKNQPLYMFEKVFDDRVN